MYLKGVNYSSQIVVSYMEWATVELNNEHQRIMFHYYYYAFDHLSWKDLTLCSRIRLHSQSPGQNNSYNIVNIVSHLEELLQ